MLLFTTAQKGRNWLLTHIIVEVAKALGGSFKLVTLVPRTVREMTQLETQKDGHIQTNQKAQMNKAKHKPRLNMHKKTHSAKLGLVAVHMEIRRPFDWL